MGADLDYRFSGKAMVTREQVQEARRCAENGTWTPKQAVFACKCSVRIPRSNVDHVQLQATAAPSCGKGKDGLWDKE